MTPRPVKPLSQKAKKLSITLSPGLVGQIEERIDSLRSESFSARIATDLATLYYALDHGKTIVRRTFGRQEMGLIFDVQNGLASGYFVAEGLESMLFLGGMGALSNLEHEVLDGIDLNHLDVKWDIERDELLEKLNNLDRLGILALYDLAREFWTANDSQANALLEAFADTRPLVQPFVLGLDLKQDGGSKSTELSRWDCWPVCAKKAKAEASRRGLNHFVEIKTLAGLDEVIVQTQKNKWGDVVEFLTKKRTEAAEEIEERHRRRELNAAASWFTND